MEAMAESAIMQGNRNVLVKQRAESPKVLSPGLGLGFQPAAHADIVQPAAYTVLHAICSFVTGGDIMAKSET
jgi:hypothetical protein